jgi:hypothetical protein
MDKDEPIVEDKDKLGGEGRVMRKIFFSHL